MSRHRFLLAPVCAFAIATPLAFVGCEKTKPKPTDEPKRVIDASPAFDARVAFDASVPDANLDVPEEDWDKCETVQQCTFVLDRCSHRKHPVNELFESKLRTKLDAACTKQPIIGLLTTMPKVECDKGRCRLGGMDGFGSALDQALLEGIAPEPTKKPKPKK